jgi:hypothetical protein
LFADLTDDERDELLDASPGTAPDGALAAAQALDLRLVTGRAVSSPRAWRA